jgi:acyl-coenzyme A synthetase/AMP-(fatty) acid ligase
MEKLLETMARAALDGPGGDKVIEYDGAVFTRAWMCAVADNLEAELQAAGIGRGGRLGFVARNRPASIAALIGMIANGRTVRMLYAFQSADALARNIEKLDLRAVVINEEDLSSPVLDMAESNGIAVIALGQAEEVRLVLPGRPGGGDQAAAEAEPCIHLLTSGTTGPPKHYPMTFRVIAGFFQDGAAGMRSTPSATPSIMYFPLGNISGLMSTVPVMLSGGWLVLHDRFDVEKWRQFMVRFRPSRLALPPAGFGMVLNANIPPEDLASAKIASTGNSALDPEVQRAFEQRYGIKILTAYGATEFAGSAVAWTEALYDEWGDRKRGSVGQVCKGVSLRIRDPESGELQRAGEVGVVEVQVERLGPEWIVTTDLGLIDEDGFVYLRGRADGAIVRGGFKILPETIEQTLTSHPDVGAAVVVGVADARLGKVPAALVQPISSERGLDPDALKAHVREHLYATHVPTNIWVVDQIPRTPSLKIDRATARMVIERKLADEAVAAS